VKHAACHGDGEDSSSLSGVVHSGLSVTGTDVFVLATDRNDSVSFFHSLGLDSELPFHSRISSVDGLHTFRGEPGWYQLPQIIATMSIVRALERARILANAAWREIVHPKPCGITSLKARMTCHETVPGQAENRSHGARLSIAIGRLMC